MIVLKRNPSTDMGTFGEFLIDDERFCYTLERPATGEHPCIPTGTYKLSWFNSPHNGWCYLFSGTEPRTMIEMHKANKYTELSGCVAPGMKLGFLDNIPAILESAIALAAIRAKLGDNFELTII